MQRNSLPVTERQTGLWQLLLGQMLVQDGKIVTVPLYPSIDDRVAIPDGGGYLSIPLSLVERDSPYRFGVGPNQDITNT